MLPLQIVFRRRLNAAGGISCFAGLPCLLKIIFGTPEKLVKCCRPNSLATRGSNSSVLGKVL